MSTMHKKFEDLEKPFRVEITFRANGDSVAVPAVIIASVNAYTLWNEHWEHVAHSTPMEDKPQYDYLNIRNKAYPWGDGDKVRILPTGCQLSISYMQSF